MECKRSTLEAAMQTLSSWLLRMGLLLLLLSRLDCRRHRRARREVSWDSFLPGQGCGERFAGPNMGSAYHAQHWADACAHRRKPGRTGAGRGWDLGRSVRAGPLLGGGWLDLNGDPNHTKLRAGVCRPPPGPSHKSSWPPPSLGAGGVAREPPLHLGPSACALRTRARGGAGGPTCRLPLRGRLPRSADHVCGGPQRAGGFA
mmetsp:Transcript_50261/g.117286  ORF Transcript_50261/g.117286 Transcript_50261/m.117286 type:complete len:202 (+) Transcript_50261:292-897(+)